MCASVHGQPTDRFMKVNHHKSNLFQLCRFGVINAYLFPERDQTFTLIDTGIIRFGHAIIREAAKLGRPVARIVLTHVHRDHVGSLEYLTRKLPEVEVAVGERESRLSVPRPLSPNSRKPNAPTPYPAFACLAPEAALHSRL